MIKPEASPKQPRQGLPLQIRKSCHTVKELVSRIDPVFDHRNRLALMVLLVTNERVDYNTLRQTLELTDGNLASHLKPLEHNGYVQVHKVFIGKKTQTTYSATESGRLAFSGHLKALDELIQLGLDE